MKRGFYLTAVRFILFICISTVPLACSSRADGPDLPDGPGQPGKTVIKGNVRDERGQPVAQVVISDGFGCTLTDAGGAYELEKHPKARFVYYSTPAGHKIATEPGSGIASFFARLSNAPGVLEHDFQLETTPAEHEFSIICMADPQVQSDTHIARFRNETAPDVKAVAANIQRPLYGLILGDVVWDRPELLHAIKSELGSLQIPLFNTIGNHDKSFADDGILFGNVFGPVDYSFNRGNVHFVCMDNVKFSAASTYAAGFSNEQVEWLKQDLSYVPENKMVILFYHIPMRHANVSNKNRVFELLKGYKEVHLMCGHTHYHENFMITAPIQAYEHIHGAACGAWWQSTLNGDGTPNGYAVYDITGNSITNWYYKSVGFDNSFQIRLHNGNAPFGGQYGIYSYGYDDGYVVANIWNADASWDVEVFEDGVSAGRMQPVPGKTDAWSQGYHIGVLNRSTSSYSQPNKHLYFHRLQQKGAQVTVRATDPFGNTYEEKTLTSDFKTAEKP